MDTVTGIWMINTVNRRKSGCMLVEKVPNNLVGIFGRINLLIFLFERKKMRKTLTTKMTLTKRPKWYNFWQCSLHFLFEICIHLVDQILIYIFLVDNFRISPPTFKIQAFPLGEETQRNESAFVSLRFFCKNSENIKEIVKNSS